LISFHCALDDGHPEDEHVRELRWINDHYQALQEEARFTRGLTRPSFKEYWLAGAQWAATRGECVRRQVGALVVLENRIVGQGYNGVGAGQPSCLQGACPRATSGVSPGSSYDTGPGACVATHGEANALLDAGRNARGADLYCSEKPCDGCMKLIRGAGIEFVYWPDGYTHARGTQCTK
jgi:dCMP deaminase